MSSIDDEALRWVMRAAGGALDPQEQAAFDAWYAAHPRHQGAYLRACAIEHSFSQLTVQHSMKPSPSSQAEDGGDTVAAAPYRRRYLAWGGALAASLAALTLFWLPPASIDRSTLITAQGEFRKVPLADRTVISMNSGTEVETLYTAKERRIILARGEAWFEVTKDQSRPFIVESGDVRVRAVGTAFAVRRYPGGADVLVTEGAVSVWSGDGSERSKQLAAGALAFVPGKGGEVQVSRDPDDIERRLAWRNGKLVFQNRSLADAVADFNRYNARQIVLADPALARKTLVGHYRLDQPELFANDVRLLFRTQVALGTDRITIGTPAAGRTISRP